MKTLTIVGNEADDKGIELYRWMKWRLLLQKTRAKMMDKIHCAGKYLRYQRCRYEKED